LANQLIQEIETDDLCLGVSTVGWVEFLRNPSLFGSAFRAESVGTKDVGTKDDGLRKNSTHPTTLRARPP
jgi:hypothetical protein